MLLYMGGGEGGGGGAYKFNSTVKYKTCECCPY